ncbi:MAG: RDD family protein [Inhella sp.]
MSPAPITQAPSLRRRLACLFYESFLAFGLLMVAGFAHYALTRRSFEPGQVTGAGLVFLGVLALYFSWCWSRGETLAMKTWYIGVRDARSGRPPAWPQALKRFAWSWLMVLPALGVSHLLALESQRRWIYIALLINLLVYAVSSRWLPGRQYLHDRLAGTELVDLRQPPGVKA